MKPEIKLQGLIKACVSFDRNGVYSAVNSETTGIKELPALEIKSGYETGYDNTLQAIKAAVKNVSEFIGKNYAEITAVLPDTEVVLTRFKSAQTGRNDAGEFISADRPGLKKGKTAFTASVGSGSGKTYAETAFTAEKELVDGINAVFIEQGLAITAVIPGIICLMDHYAAEIAAKPGLLIDVEDDYMSVLLFDAQKIPVYMFSKWKPAGLKFKEHLTEAVKETERRARAYTAANPEFKPDCAYAAATGGSAAQVEAMLKNRFSFAVFALKPVKDAASMASPQAAAVAIP